MFVRFRETEYRLQLSLVETRRDGGKVRHEHIASLGSIEAPPSVAARIEFWRRLHERLGRLGNRVDPATQAKLLGDVHARVPMVTMEEQQALKLENAETDARFWADIHDVNEQRIGGQRQVIALTEADIAKSQAAVANAANHSAEANERVERLKRGEDVPGGLVRPALDLEKVLRKAGFSTSDLTYARLSASLPEDAIPKIAQAAVEGSERATRRMTRKLVRERDDKDLNPNGSSPGSAGEAAKV
jgi:hypothetical protein